MLGMEQFLSARFAEMPMPARVLTYLALLGLFRDQASTLRVRTLPTSALGKATTLDVTEAILN